MAPTKPNLLAPLAAAILLLALALPAIGRMTETITYHYDDTYQLATSVYSGYSTAYRYDAAGNIKSVNTGPADSTAPSTTVTAPTANAALRGTTASITGTASDTGSGPRKPEKSRPMVKNRYLPEAAGACSRSR